MPLSTEGTIASEIVIDAPAARVFAALTDPEQILQWWGSPEAYRTTGAQCDVRVGGSYRLEATSSEGNVMNIVGTFLEVDPPKRLAYTWNPSWEDDMPETIVRFDLTERDGSTLVRLEHTGFVAAEARDGHDRGWTLVLGWLKAFTEQ